MKIITSLLRRIRAVRPRYLALIALPPIAAISLLAISQSTPSTHPTISLASEPLYARGTRDKPTLTLALSVEFPTVGAQYSNPADSSNDNTYAPTTEYVGYFDTESCYTYNNAPTEVDSTATNYSDYKRFDRSGAATNRACGGTGFSGNFMNWATSSAVDMLRMGLTGGDRIIDTATLTILQRAVLQSDNFNNSYFPSKRLVATHVPGAVPSNLTGTHTGDVYIANCFNRVFFGTAKAGNCNSPGTNGNLGVTGGTAGTTALATTQGYFFSRVKVCDVSGTDLLDNRKFNDENYCVKYPAGNFKPVGNLQKYSDAMRISVFGYLNQDGTPRYGGVLRAPMKYVGPKYFDSNGVQSSTSNPHVEWDVSTGVFVDNPLSDSMGISGVINYVNKFGRTGAYGEYKGNDPVGELYYEALRYLQGLAPTSGTTAATSPTYGMTDTHKDGFPVYETWADPHDGGDRTKDYTCLKNNLFTIGDIGTHADKYIPGNTRTGNDDLARSYSVANNEPDFTFWTKVVGAFEDGEGISYKVGSESTTRTVKTRNPNGTTGNYKRYTDLYTSSTDNLATRNTGAGSAAYYMAGMAYWAKNHDIRGTDWTAEPAKQRPGMRVTTYMLDVNQNASSSGTDTRRKSQFFLTAKYGGFNDVSGVGNPYYRKDTGGSAISGIADTADTGGSTKYVSDNSIWDKSDINYFNPTQAGEARSHFLASDGRGILTTLSNIFATIAREGNSIAGGAISTQRLTSVGGYVYQAQFDAAEWTGDLVSQYVRVSNTNEVTISSGIVTDPHQWYAAEKLNAKVAATPDASTRNIVVGKTSPTASATATNFKWNEIDSDHQTALNKATPSSSEDDLGDERLNFVRGVRTLEGTTVSGTVFRKRGGLLGDILNSGVAYSGVPTANNTGTAYATFYNANKNRTKTLFVGANDGMLHAFNANDGEEIFGYIPSWLVGKLPALTSSTYNASGHQSYLDGSPAVAEAEVGSATNWKTVLVSGTGAGGQGVFALDVTDPDDFGPSKVMWEFTDRDDADLGNVVGRPQILKFRTSAPGATTTTYKWFAVVPSGVNNNANDGYFSTTGKPALFLLDLAKGSSVAWQENVNYYKISFPAGSTSLPSGIANFSATGGYSGEVSTIYLGDLQGSVWKLNFVAAGTSGWNIDTLSFFKTGGSTSTAIPMYVAKDASGAVQPITAAPALTRGPNSGVIVVLSTGKYLETADNVVTSSTQVQSVFAILDNGNPTADSTGTPTSAIAGRGRLKAGSMNTTTGVVSTPTFTWGRAASDTDTTQRSGWYADFPTSGERQVSGFGILGTKMVFGSVIPPNSVTDPCGSGSGYQYFVDVATGTGTRSISQVGLLGEPFVLELGSDIVGSVDSTGKRKRTTKGQIILQGSEGIQVVVGDGAGGSFEDISTVGRLSWRQINNYSELKAAAAAVSP